MLLFSTILDINEKLTREALMELVTEWNRTSDYQENIIPGLKWNGEMPFFFVMDTDLFSKIV